MKSVKDAARALRRHSVVASWWSSASSRAHGDPSSLFGVVTLFSGSKLQVKITNISSATPVRGLRAVVHNQAMATRDVVWPQRSVTLHGTSSGLYRYAAEHSTIPVEVSWTVRSLRIPFRRITRTHTFHSPLVDGDVVASDV
ncbi:hypothetical protein [Corynebacterium falsenii]|uniref:hypothetical protein n=1 Tax=Corynebacterium falsenii TaxID=108486 RepID=UPI003FD4B7BF